MILQKQLPGDLTESLAILQKRIGFNGQVLWIAQLLQGRVTGRQGMSVCPLSTMQYVESRKFMKTFCWQKPSEQELFLDCASAAGPIDTRFGQVSR